MQRTLGVALVALCATLVLTPPAWGGNQTTYNQLVALGAQIDAAKADPEQAQALAQLIGQYNALAATLGGDDPAGLLDGAGSSSLNGPPALLAPPAPPGGATNTATFSNMTATPIPDGPGGMVASTVTATTADTYIWDIDLTLDITHTFSSDLEVTLTSPGGTTVTIITDNGGGNDDVYAGTTFDDSAADAATDFIYTNLVVATPLIPEGELAAFIGEDPNGTWTLDVTDDAGIDTGTLNSWSIDVTTLPTPPINDPVVSGSNATATPIPDGPGGMLSSTLTIAGAGAFACDVNLTVAITHTFSSDLEVFLTSPAGTTTTITTDNGGGNDDVYNGTTFDSSAPDTVTDFIYTNLVVATPLQAEGAMGAYIGEDTNGTWTLDITDDAGIDTGTLNSWSVDVVSCASTPPPPEGVIPTLNTVGMAVLLFLLVAAAFWAMRRRTA